MAMAAPQSLIELHLLHDPMHAPMKAQLSIGANHGIEVSVPETTGSKLAVSDPDATQVQLEKKHTNEKLQISVDRPITFAFDNTLQANLKDFALHYELLKKYADDNDTSAQLNLAVALLWGTNHATISAKEGFRYLSIAAQKQDNSPANLCARGYCHLLGNVGGVPGRDITKAKEFFSRAAKQNYIPAIFKLAHIEYHESFKEKNFEKRKLMQSKINEQFKKCADNNHPSAQNALGVSYCLGHGTEKPDNVIGLNLYKSASILGHATARINLGILYEFGEAGLAEDKAKAKQLFTEAQKQGLNCIEHLKRITSSSISCAIL